LFASYDLWPGNGKGPTLNSLGAHMGQQDQEHCSVFLELLLARDVAKNKPPAYVE